MSMKLYVTYAGVSVLEVLRQIGASPKITRAALGDGVVASDEEAQSLSAPKHFLMDADGWLLRREDSVNVVAVSKINQDMTAGINVNEVMVYCEHPDFPDDSSEWVPLLYLTFGDRPDWIAPYTLTAGNDAQYVRIYELAFSASLVDVSGFTASPGMIVTHTELDALTATIRALEVSLPQEMQQVRTDVTAQLDMAVDGIRDEMDVLEGRVEDELSVTVQTMRNEMGDLTEATTDALATKQDKPLSGAFTLLAGAAWVATGTGYFAQTVAAVDVTTGAPVPVDDGTNLTMETEISLPYEAMEPVGKFGVGIKSQAVGTITFWAKKQPDVPISGAWTWKGWA